MNFWTKFRSIGATWMMDCRTASRAQSEMLDRPLSPSTRAGLWLHLLICKWCRRYGKQIRFLREAARDHPDQLTGAAPPGLSAEARERIKRSLQGKS
jgi:hypothetical protein